ncbi:MAG TPA: farnesyl diphosphate synthase [Gammaproteobacteria bacterium]|nr:farnesyl diphosphate synthase [Gammaproteobacteria bacterium]
MSTNIFDLSVYLQQKQQLVNSLLANILPISLPAMPLHSAMRYAVLNPGKRLRPILVYAVGDVLDVPPAALHAAAMSIELVHCYSLIHDDLPAMDDDDLRRGLPACHRAFDEATAILAGDGLQALAFEILSDPDVNPLSPAQQIAMVKVLAKAAGVFGMVLGQAQDLAAEQKNLNLTELTALHQNKTGALFNACIELSIIAASNASAEIQHDLRRYSRHLGLAFQIHDDILDVTGNQEQLGKPVGSDQKHAKSTFTSLLGLDAAREQAQANLDLALEAIAPLGDGGVVLNELARYLITRNY